MSSNEDLHQLAARIRRFAEERKWDEVRTAKDLCLAIGIETAELQEHFLWQDVAREAELIQASRGAIEAELADVFIYLLALADRLGTDLMEAASSKMDENEQRFPARKIEET